MLLFVSVWFGMCTVALNANESSDNNTYGIKQLEEIMLENNNHIIASTNNVNSVKNRMEESSFLFGPELKIGYSYFPGGSVGGLFANDVDQLADTTIHYPLLQNIMKVPTIKNERNADLNVARAELQDSINSELFDLRKLYYEALIEKELSKTSYENLLLWKDIYKSVKERYKAGESLLPEILKVEEEINNTREKYINHLSSYNNKIDILSSITGLEQDLIEIKDEWKEIELNTNLQEIVSKAFTNNPELRIPIYKANAADARIDRAKFEHLELNTQAGYVIADNPGGIDQGVWFRLEFAAPFFYFQLKDKNKNESLHEKFSWQKKNKLSKINLEKDIHTAYKELTEIQSEINSNELRIEEAKENLRIKKSIIDYPTQAASDVTKSDLLREKINLNNLNAELNANKLKKNIIIYHLVYLAGVDSEYKLASGNYQSEPPVGMDISDQKSVWMWSVDFLGDKDSEKAVLSHLKQNNFEKIFLSFDRELINSLPDNQYLSDFIYMLNQNGIKSQALLGEHTWINREVRHDLIYFVNKIIEYNKIVGEDSKFKALHLDIEPHAFNDWNNNEKRYLSLFVETLKEVDVLLSNKAPELELWVDIPDWYDRIDTNLLSEIINVSDQVVLMAYGKLETERLLEAVREELVMGETYGKGVWIGLESKDFIENNLDLNDLIQFQKDIVNDIAFSISGFAIHDFSHHKMLFENYTKEFNNTALHTTNFSNSKNLMKFIDKSQDNKKESKKNNLYAGSFSVQKNALDLSNTLREKGYDPYVKKVEFENGNIFYRVSLGNFDTKTQAKKHLKKVKKDSGINTNFFIIEEK